MATPTPVPLIPVTTSAREQESIMPTLYRYAQFSDAIYRADEDAMKKALVELGCGAWSVRKWHPLSRSNGFQGAVLESDKEVVCVFKGSTFGKAFVDDWLVNDVLIAINALPPQMWSALEMVLAAEMISGNGAKPLSLVGHSLGGGLAQILGAIRGLPFVTFNAPGMKGNLSTYGYLGGTSSKQVVQGFNMILWTDPVGNYGRHLGKTERFMTPGALNPFGGAAVIAHQMGNVLLALNQAGEWAAKLLAQLI
jgi:hypothetical protein